MQRLLDVVADVPGLLQDSDELNAQGESIENSAKQDLRDRILTTLNMLLTWRYHWGRDYPNIAYTVTIEPSTVLTQLQVPEEYAAKSVWFTRFERAHELVLYNAALLLLVGLLETWEITYKLSSILANQAIAKRQMAPLQPLLLPSSVISPSQVIDEIYRCVSYFLHPAHSRSGVIAVFHPLLCWYVPFIA